MHFEIKVKGRVQGVFFRASTKRKAEELGVTGFVENKPNGDVYIEAQGEQVQELINWIKAGGPEMAKVNAVLISENKDQTFVEFAVRH